MESLSQLTKFMNQMKNEATQTPTMSDIIAKLRFLEMLQIEIQKNFISFQSKLSSFLEMAKSQLGLELSAHDVVQFLLMPDSNSESNKLFLGESAGVLNKISHSANEEKITPKIEDDINKYENASLKAKYATALKMKDPKRHFQVYYVFKSKIKRMYRIDCMTRKINVNFYHYLRDNYHSLNINDEFLDFFRSNIRYTSREKFQQLFKKYPQFTDIYDGYLESTSFKKLLTIIKKKYDNEYQKLFYRHSINFLNFYLKEHDNVNLTNKVGIKGERLKRLGKSSNS